MTLNPPASFIEYLVNHPEIRPSLMPPVGYIDMSRYYDRPGNIAFRIDDGVMLFPLVEPGIHDSHFLFPGTMRGKAARRAARQMIGKVFAEYHTDVIRGAPPRDHRAVRTFGYGLGFRQTGQTYLEHGVEYVCYELRKDQWVVS